MMKTLKIIDEEFCVCQVADYGKVDFSAPYVFIGSTEEEKSLVCPVRFRLGDGDCCQQEEDRLLRSGIPDD